MKKIIFILALFVSFVANAQYTPPPGYTNINSRYDWLAGVFRALGIPAGGSAAFTTGQSHRSGAIYYDSTGVDSGLYVWSGLAWRNYDPATLTASEGLTKVGSDFQLGGTVTSDRTITVNNGSFKINKSKNVSADYMFLSTDTVSSPDLDANIPFSGFLNKRTLRFPSYSSTTYRVGAQFNLNVQIKDSATLNTFGGDFSSANKTTMVLEKMSGYSGRSVYMGGTSAAIDEGVPIQLSDLTLQHSTSTTSNYRYAKNYWLGSRSYLLIGQADTLQKWVGFHNMGFMQGTAHLDYSFDFVGGYFGDQSAARVTNPWFLYGHSTRSKSFIAGPTGFGDSTIDASALVDMSSTTKGMLPPRMSAAQRTAIGSPGPSLFLWDNDSTRYMGYNGTSWKGIAWTGEGGGTPGIDDVLAIGQSLTTNRTINTDASGLTISGAPSSFGATLNLSNSSGEGNALSASSNGLNSTVFSNNTKTSAGGGWAFYGQSVGSVPTGTLIRDSSSTNTAVPVLSLTRRTTGTAAEGIGSILQFLTETGGSDFMSSEISSKWINADQTNRTSEVDINGVDTGVTKVFMNIQQDLVRINNNADTLATKAYARSVGGGGGTWGSITGTLSDQTDLQAALDAKATGSITQNWFDDDLTLNGVTTKINRADFFDDMLTAPVSNSGTSYMFKVASGTGADASIGGTVTPPNGDGWATMTPGTTSTGFAALGSTSTSTSSGLKNKIDTTKTYRFETNVQIETLSDGTDRFRFIAGMAGHLTDAGGTNKIWFRYSDNVNSGNWTCYSGDGTTTESTNSGVAAAAGTTVKLGFEYDNAAIRFYINGSLVATHTTRLPEHNSAGMFPTIAVTKELGTTNRNVFIDYVKYRRL